MTSTTATTGHTRPEDPHGAPAPRGVARRVFLQPQTTPTGISHLEDQLVVVDGGRS